MHLSTTVITSTIMAGGKLAVRQRIVMTFLTSGPDFHRSSEFRGTVRFPHMSFKPTRGCKSSSRGPELAKHYHFRISRQQCVQQEHRPPSKPATEISPHTHTSPPSLSLTPFPSFLLLPSLPFLHSPHCTGPYLPATYLPLLPSLCPADPILHNRHK